MASAFNFSLQYGEVGGREGKLKSALIGLDFKVIDGQTANVKSFWVKRERGVILLGGF